MHDWLARNRTFLKKLAPICLKEMEKRNLSLSSIPDFPPVGPKSKNQRLDFQNEIVQELSVFLLESPRLWPEISAWPVERADNLKETPGHPPKKAVNFIVTSFINHCIVQNRKAENGSYWHFRKRVLEALNPAHGFQKHKRETPDEVKARGTVLYYSLPPHKERLLRITADEWDEFSFPPGVPVPLSFSDACKGENIRKLAAVFYRKAVDVTGGLPGRVRLSDFFQWIRDREGIPPNRYHPSIDDETPPRFAGRDFISENTGAGPAPDRKSLLRQAESVVKKLTDRRREALKYYACHQYTLEKTARRMGLKGASGVSPHLKAAVHEIQEKFREAVEGFDIHPSKDLQQIFLDMICEIIAARSEKNGAGVVSKDRAEKNNCS